MGSRILQVAFDIGGTFTDFALFDSSTGRVEIWKVLTTRREPARAVIESLAARVGAGSLPVDEVAGVLHATTIATNAILERKGSLRGRSASQRRPPAGSASDGDVAEDGPDGVR